MRFGAALLGLFFVLAGSGCLIAGATVAAVGAVAATTIKTAGKVTVATVETTGRMATTALTSSGEVTALTMESAAKLAKTGLVVVVDASSGLTTELPWQHGMTLHAAARAENLRGSFSTAKIFRDGNMMDATLKGRSGALPLYAGDVVELHR